MITTLLIIGGLVWFAFCVMLAMSQGFSLWGSILLMIGFLLFWIFFPELVGLYYWGIGWAG